MALIPFVIERSHRLVLVMGSWSWESFLKPLNSDSKPEPSHRIVQGQLRPFDKELVSRFSADLTAQHDTIKKQNGAEAEKEEREAEEELRNLVGLVDLEELGKRWSKYEGALKKSLKVNSDLNRSGSAWKVKMLERYIQRQDIGFVQPERLHDHFRPKKLTNGIFQKIVEKVDLSMQAISDRIDEEDVGITELPNGCTESDTRMIIDAILQPICVEKGLVIRTEQTIKSSHSDDSEYSVIELPTNKYDYIMYHKGTPVGVVEAKRKRCLKDDYVAQLLVQLLLLCSWNPNLFYFGVLSDACQFVFAGLSKQKVWFFQGEDSQLDVLRVYSTDDLKAIVENISWLIDLVKGTINRGPPSST